MQLTFIETDGKLVQTDIPEHGAYAGYTIEEKYSLFEDHDFVESFDDLQSAYDAIAKHDLPDTRIEITHNWTTCAHGRNAEGISGESDDVEHDTFANAYLYIISNADIHDFLRIELDYHENFFV